MWHDRVRALLRLVVLSLLLGLIPPAATPQAQARSTAIAGPPAANAAPAAAAQPTPPKPVASTPVPHPEPPPPSIPAKAPTAPGHSSAFGTLPLVFTPNAGQTDASVRYHVRGLGGNIFFTPQEVVFTLPTSPRARRQAADQGKPPVISATSAMTMSVLRLRYEGAKSAPSLTAVNPLPGTANYLIGNDSAKWHTNLPTYAGVQYQQLYSGIDLRYDGTDGHLKTTFTVAPGASPSLIRWSYQGASDVHVDADGRLLIIIDTPGNGRPRATTPYTLTEQAPIAWQMLNGRQVFVPARFAVSNNQRVNFTFGAYDSRQPLVIDPALTYSTLIGGGSDDFATSIAADNDGNAYITGNTSSPLFPTTTNTFSNTLIGVNDAFVTKIDPTGSTLVFSTFIEAV